MKVAFFTLGCKVNQYESAAMGELFAKRGYDVVDFGEKADVYVINTCDVTNESARKSRQMIRKAIRKNPMAKVVVVGCYSQVEPNKIAKIPGVDIILGTKNRNKIVDLIEAHEPGQRLTAVGDIMKQRNFEDITYRGLRHHTRAFLKIQEGCNMFCSYCIIPYARGPLRSRSIESIMKETQNLAEDGFKEIVLTGIHLGLYGIDFDYTPNLLDIINEISSEKGIERIRLSSIEALEITDEFLLGVSKINKFCNHFHVPLQSGNDKILKLMNRRYTTREYMERILSIRKFFPDVSITTDVIVGFPGETDKDFEETVAFIKKVGFSRLHVFPFSPRRGTKAYNMPNQIEKKIKNSRSQYLIKLSECLEKNYQEKFINKTLDVLFEEEIEKDIFEGYTRNYIKTRTRSSDNLQNEIVPTTLINNNKGYVEGNI